MDNFLPRGTTFARLAICKALAQDPIEQHRIAVSRFGARSTAAEILKSAVAGSTGENIADSENVQLEFLEQVRLRTVLDRLPHVRNVPVKTPFCATADGATAYWTEQGRATPVSKLAFDRETMFALTIAALTVFPKEILASPDPKAEALIRNDLIRAAVELTDRTFLDPANAGITGKMPASVTYGATEVYATESFSNDVASAIDAFGGDLQTACWVMNPRVAAKLGLSAGGRGAANDLGALGGTLAGLPVFTSKACEIDSDGYTITLLDGGSLCLVDEGAEINTSTQASVEMDNAPSGDGITPTAASTAMVSLFQTDSVGLIVSRAINWKMARTNASVAIVAAGYASLA